MQEWEVCEGQQAVFSRSDHIKSLGLYSEEDGLELETDDVWVDLEPDLEPDLRGKGQRTVGEGVEVGVECIISQGNHQRSWDDFKAEFDDVFRDSEEKMASGDFHSTMPTLSTDALPSTTTPRTTTPSTTTPSTTTPSTTSTNVLPSTTNTNAPSADMRHDLIIEMITSLHDARECATKAGGLVESKQDNLAHKQNSPTRPRRQLLSLSTLETIHEAEIDRLLESMENSAPEPVQNGNDPSGSEAMSALPPKEWGIQEETSNDQLLEQLHQLSLRQANGRKGYGDRMVSSAQTANGLQGAHQHLQNHVIHHPEQRNGVAG